MDYESKYNSFLTNGLYRSLSQSQRDEIRDICKRYAATKQEFIQLVEYSCDLGMWGEKTLWSLWQELEQTEAEHILGPQRRKRLMRSLRAAIEEMRTMETDYRVPVAPPVREKLHIASCHTDKKIYGECPVQSPKTVCCNLKTIDAVENCLYGCSYCTIQTFYGDEVRFDPHLKEKLDAIEIDPSRFYHFGTGQSSDSLAWGNKENNLKILCDWADKHRNILLEFKTKSSTVSWFLENKTPPNIVCSWSLNTPTIITNEEHFTASLDQRLMAARAVADEGVKVAFHFHPMIYYKGWQDDYSELAQRVMGMFEPDEVHFISFGTVTFIKPVMQEIRKRGEATKILQMQPTPDPHGKLSYPDDIKIKLFRHMDRAFEPWRQDVYRYLCMEHKRFWDKTFGWHYKTNEEFEIDFAKHTLGAYT